MGYSGVARWGNADADSMAKVERNICVNHNGTYAGRWHLSLKSYRSTFGIAASQTDEEPSSHNNERVMITMTKNDVVFVLLEDPVAPSHTDTLPPMLGPPTHYRNTLITLRPPGSLEGLLNMLKASWMPVRHAFGNQNTGISMGAGTGLGMAAGKRGPHQNGIVAAEMVVEGKVFTIGTDWVVRIGLVRSKDLLKGMVLEAEYLPIPAHELQNGALLDAVVSDMLGSVLPNMSDMAIWAATVTPAQWKDVMWDPEYEKQKEAEAKAREAKAGGDALMEDIPENDDDVYAYGIEEIPHVPSRDWMGIDRERRSAYTVASVLRNENAL